MELNMRRAILLVLFLFLVLTSCTHSQTNSNANQSLSPSTAPESSFTKDAERMSDTIDDSKSSSDADSNELTARYLDAVPLTTISGENIVDVKVGDTFLGLTVEEILYKQEYVEGAWIPTEVDVLFSGNITMNGIYFFGGPGNFRVSQESLEKIPVFALDGRHGGMTLSLYGEVEFRENMRKREEEASLIGVDEILVSEVIVKNFKIIFRWQSGAMPRAEVISIDFDNN